MNKCCKSFKSENVKTNNDNINFKNKNTCVTDFVRFLSQGFMTKILDDYIEEIEINKITTEIKIDNILEIVTNEKKISESVSEINGTMIPMYYKYLTKKI